jgi:folate-dependent phosphoribosylglycinamide formyltransferase PurN
VVAKPSPTVVILCGGAPRHVYVANRLCRSLDVRAIVQEVGRRITPAKLASMAKPNVAARKIGRWLRDRKRYAGNREAGFFFEQAQVRLDRPDLLQRAEHINDAAVVETVKRMSPDIIAVFGTSLIRPPLLGLGRIGMLNLHGGLSPDYRGADCTFWALYNGEPEQVGCTLHFINAGIDTGALIAHVCPKVLEGDDELTLFWRAVRDSAEVYAQAIERLGQGEPLGRRQDRKGRLYQVKDRTWAAEREFARRLPGGIVRGASLPARVKWFGVETTSPLRPATSELLDA